jgi:hypothetical protein
MTKDQPIFRKHTEWIAIGVFAEALPLVTAVRELTSAGVSLTDLCLAGPAEGMRRLAAAREVRRLDRLAALLRSAVEMRLPGSGEELLAAPTCVGNPILTVSPAIADRLRGSIIDGCILVGVHAATAVDATRAARVLLRYSSRHVHVLRLPPEAHQRGRRELRS